MFIVEAIPLIKANYTEFLITFLGCMQIRFSFKSSLNFIIASF